MKSWKAVCLLILLVAALLAPDAVAGQEPADSMTTTIHGRPVTVDLTGPQHAYEGDTLLYMARALDKDGEPTFAALKWSIHDTTQAELRTLSDSVALVVAKKTGTITVLVRVAPLDSLRVGALLDDGTRVQVLGATAEGTMRVTLRVPELVKLCALWFSGEDPLVYSSEECRVGWQRMALGAPAELDPSRRVTIYNPLAETSPSFSRMVQAVEEAEEPVLGLLSARRLSSSPPATEDQD